MGQITTEDNIAAITTPMSSQLAALGTALRGTGSDTHVLHEQLTKTTSALPGIGVSAADQVEALRTSTEFPVEHRAKLIAGVLQGANDAIQKSHADATKFVRDLEANLVDGTLPHIHADSTERLLLRQELDNLYRDNSDKSKIARDRLGWSTAHDAELLGNYGRTLLGNDYETFRTAAAAHYAKGSTGTELQLASRRALQVFRDGKILAAPTAFETAARMHLRRVTS